MKILVTAIGSMAADSVISSLRKSEPDTQIIGTDIYPSQWLKESKKVDLFYQVPKALDDGYIDFIYDICIDNNVKYIIPLIDFEVDLFSVHEERFTEVGITICISPLSAINICRNKYVTYHFFKETEEVDVIPSYNYHEIPAETVKYPIIVKPKKGRSSEGIFLIHDPELLCTKVFNNNELFFQPYMKGEVYTVDIVRDSYGNSVSIVRKELIRNRSGVGLTVCIKEDHILNLTAAVISERLDIKGAINIEFLFSEGSYYLMDINPRFSAGIRFSIGCGYDIVSNHLKCFKGLHIDKLSTIKGGIYY